ncbi:MAG: ABC-type phosphate/phosphonate transport system permease subunit, partial [Planctomycetota bacterium]
MALTPDARWGEIQEAKKSAPGDRVLLVGVIVFLGCCALSWFTLDLGLTHPVTGKSRFEIQPQFVRDVIPFPLREQHEDGSVSMRWDTGVFLDWVSKSAAEVGWSGVFETVAISIVAIMIAALIAIFLVIPASRNV